MSGDGASRFAQRKAARAMLLAASGGGAAGATVAEVQARRRSAVSAAAAVQCQRCLQHGHYTYECRGERVYVARVSRSEQLANGGGGGGDATAAARVRH